MKVAVNLAKVRPVRRLNTSLHPPTRRTLAIPAACLQRTHPQQQDKRSLFSTSAACSYGAKSDQNAAAHFAESWDEFQKYFHFPAQSRPEDFKLGNTVTVYGFLEKPKHMSAKLSFAKLVVDKGPVVSITSKWDVPDSAEHLAHQSLKSVPSNSAVAVTGVVEKLESSADPEQLPEGWLRPATDSIEIIPKSIQVLSPFPKDIIVSEGVRFPPRSRHLQLRFSKALQERLHFRHEIQGVASAFLDRHGFSMVETPVLFKSTPEGAREFVVPTRRPGFAYALPQSPQQYKQILMASGVGRYYQFARCFRDEDLRADRQPEFTQLDLEMSFARGEDVMQLIENLVRDIYSAVRSSWALQAVEEELIPVHKTGRQSSKENYRKYWDLPAEPFQRITYQEAMSKYGSDKPDLRIPNKIHQIKSLVASDFISKITDLNDPVVEAIKFRLNGSVEESRQFVKEFWDALPASLAKNPDGEPVVMIFDPRQPQYGLAPLGYEAVMKITDESSGLGELSDFEEGDILVVQARDNKPFEGGSTALGNIRLGLAQAAVEKGLLEPDERFMFLWVHGFPLFSPNNETDPGQGGASGFSSTHHPFTAPLTSEDFELLLTDPLKVKADHYDLVLNGVELGGGSRRIHIAEVQEFILRDILQMTDDGVSHFSHLLEALRAGCPPHAGFAFGWDRLIAVLSFTNSVRDVIAFPKSMKGEDLMVKSPGAITDEQLSTYHLAKRAHKGRS